MTETWRLLSDPPASGAYNMAADEATLGAVGGGEALPTLRLYAWTPACLSLGYAQPGTDADRARLAEHGWDAVRRMTGGRAILHVDELTYSVTLPAGHALAAGGIIDSYRRLSGALLGGLARLGLTTDTPHTRAAKQPGVTGTAGAVCFETPSDYEITVGGKKLIGSAQVRKQNAVLQHGSLPLAGDLSRICDALVFADEAARDTARRRVLDRALTLADALGRQVAWTEAADALCAAFESAFAITLRPAARSPAERAAADALTGARYATESWTYRV